jgi:hypothetical protein
VVRDLQERDEPEDFARGGMGNGFGGWDDEGLQSPGTRMDEDTFRFGGDNINY